MKKSKSMFTTTPPGGGLENKPTPVFKKHTRNYYNLFIALSGAGGAAAIIMSVIISALYPSGQGPTLTSLTLQDGSQVQVSSNVITVDQPITGVAGTAASGAKINLLNFYEDTNLSFVPINSELPTKFSYSQPLRPLDEALTENNVGDIFASYLSFYGANFLAAQDKITVKSANLAPFAGTPALHAVLENQTNIQLYEPRAKFSPAGGSIKFNFYLQKSNPVVGNAVLGINFNMGKALETDDPYFKEGFKFLESGAIMEYSASLPMSPVQIGSLPPNFNLLGTEATFEIVIQNQQVIGYIGRTTDLNLTEVLRVPAGDFFSGSEVEYVSPGIYAAAETIPAGESLDVDLNDLTLSLATFVPSSDDFDGEIGFALRDSSGAMELYDGGGIADLGHGDFRSPTPDFSGGETLHLALQSFIKPPACGDAQCQPSEFALRLEKELITPLVNPKHVVADENFTYVIEVPDGVGTAPQLEVYSIQDPVNPVYEGRTYLSGIQYHPDFQMVAENGYLYIGNTSPDRKVQIYDVVSEPGEAVSIGSVTGYSTPYAVYENYLFVGKTGVVATNDDITIFDVSNPASPQLLGTMPSLYTGELKAVEVRRSDNLAYPKVYAIVNGTGEFSDEWSFQVFQFDSSAGGYAGHQLRITGQANGLEVLGRYAYVSHSSSQIFVIDITDPTNPVRVESLATGGVPYEISTGTVNTMSGTWSNLYARVGTYFKVYDIASDPASPAIIISYAIGNVVSSHVTEDSVIYGVRPESQVFDTWIMETNCPSDCQLPICGNSVCERPAENISNCPVDCPDVYCGDDVCSPEEYILSSAGGAFTGNPSPEHMLVKGDYAYIITKEDATNFASLETFDISNPAYPVNKGIVSLGSYGVTYGPDMRMAISGNYLYLSDITHDLIHVFDVGSSPGNVSSHTTVEYLGYDFPVAVYEDYLFVGIDNPPGYVSPFDILDISDPSNPQSLPAYEDFSFNLSSNWHTPMSINDLVGVEFREISGSDYPMIYILHNDTELGRIFLDVYRPGSTDPLAYDFASHEEIGLAYGLEVVGNYAYISASQGAIPRIYVVDISNPADPNYAGVVTPSSAPHELFATMVPGLGKENLYVRVGNDLQVVYNITDHPTSFTLTPTAPVGDLTSIYVPDYATGRVYGTSSALQMFRIWSLQPSCVADCGMILSGTGGGTQKFVVEDTRLPALVNQSLDLKTGLPDDVSIALLTIEPVYSNGLTFPVTAYVDIPQAYRGDPEKQALFTHFIAETYCRERIAAQIYLSCNVDYVSFGTALLADNDGGPYVYQSIGSPVATVNLGGGDADYTTGEFNFSIEKLDYGTHMVVVTSLNSATGELTYTNYTINVQIADADNDGVADKDDYCVDTLPGSEVDCFGCSELQMDPDGDNFCSYVPKSGGQVQTSTVRMAAAGTCNYNGKCEKELGEDYTSCPSDCPAPVCDNDRICENNEDPYGCPSDCSTPICGNNRCQYGETPSSCQDCMQCNDNMICEDQLAEYPFCTDCANPICGNTYCEPGETYETCYSDCGSTICDYDTVCEPEIGETNNCTDCNPPICNNNGMCEPERSETYFNCRKDCGYLCGDGFCDGRRGETDITCLKDCTPQKCVVNGMCEAEYGETSKTCPDDCAVGPICGNGACEVGEDENNCPADCAAPFCNNNGICESELGETSKNCPDCAITIPVCGNGMCEVGEDQYNCPADCGPVGPVCGNGACEVGEDEYSCPADCAPVCKESIWCNVSLGKDQCPDVPGQYQGCPYGNEATINLEITDLSIAQDRCNLMSAMYGLKTPYPVPTQSCTFPVGNDEGISGPHAEKPTADIYAFNLDGLIGQTVTRKTGEVVTLTAVNLALDKTLYDLILHQYSGNQGLMNALVGSCTTDNLGKCIVGKPAPGSYLVIADARFQLYKEDLDNPTGWIRVRMVDGLVEDAADFQNGLASPHFTFTSTYLADETWTPDDGDGDGTCDVGTLGVAGVGVNICQGFDYCTGTEPGDEVNTYGCSESQVDEDDDGLCDPNMEPYGAPYCTGADQCPETYGRAAYFGCPYADKNIVDLHVIDKYPSKDLCTVVAGTTGINGSCKVPFTPNFGPVEMKVFDRNLLNGMTTTSGKVLVKNNKEDLFPEIYEDAALASAIVGKCTIGADGTCLAGEEYRGDFLVLGKARFTGAGVPPELATKTVYFGLPKSPTDFIDGLATKNFQVVITRDKAGKFWVTAGQKFTVVGSYLEMIVPQFTVWEGTTQVYPFVFYSDSDWTVDVCLAVPEGYQIIDPGTCAQALIGGQPESVLFTLKEVSSPKPDVKVKMKMQHKGKTKNLDFSIPGRRKGKDK